MAHNRHIAPPSATALLQALDQLQRPHDLFVLVSELQRLLAWPGDKVWSAIHELEAAGRVSWFATEDPVAVSLTASGRDAAKAVRRAA